MSLDKGTSLREVCVSFDPTAVYHISKVRHCSRNLFRPKKTAQGKVILLCYQVPFKFQRLMTILSQICEENILNAVSLIFIVLAAFMFHKCVSARNLHERTPNLILFFSRLMILCFSPPPKIIKRKKI